jgi:hypothetical protein
MSVRSAINSSGELNPCIRASAGSQPGNDHRASTENSFAGILENLVILLFGQQACFFRSQVIGNVLTSPEHPSRLSVLVTDQPPCEVMFLLRHPDEEFADVR